MQCCPKTNLECQAEVDDDPRCSNPRWDLFRNFGYFCCQNGFTGYNATKTGTNGCKPGKDDLEKNQQRLEIIRKGEGKPAFILPALLVLYDGRG